MSTARDRIKYTKLKETAELEDTDEADTTIKPKSTAKKVFKRIKRKSKDEYYDDQFEDTPIKTPVKSILIAIILFVIGSIMLTIGSLMLAGVIGQGTGSFRAAPLMVIGSIIFIPGAYNVRTAYYAWKGYRGFSYADIAGFGEDQ